MKSVKCCTQFMKALFMVFDMNHLKCYKLNLIPLVLKKIKMQAYNIFIVFDTNYQIKLYLISSSEFCRWNLLIK